MDHSAVFLPSAECAVVFDCPTCRKMVSYDLQHRKGPRQVIPRRGLFGVKVRG